MANLQVKPYVSVSHIVKNQLGCLATGIGVDTTLCLTQYHAKE